MLIFAMICCFLCIVLLVYGLANPTEEDRPTLKLEGLEAAGLGPSAASLRRSPTKMSPLFIINIFSVVVRPLIGPVMRQRLLRSLYVAQVDLTPEAFVLIKVFFVVAILVTVPFFVSPDLLIFVILIAIVAGYMLPEMWLRSKINKAKQDLIKYLPDAVDLLGLCVSAGLDFMMALKWVVDKSAQNIVTMEMGNLLQEISVGKPRRDALRDMAKKYDVPDLSTFARTLIQADKMGTSVNEALTILSEDMRLARFRRGEAIALKAPLKMLVPMLFCIFPVVGILVGAPIFLDFINNNPLKAMG